MNRNQIVKKNGRKKIIENIHYGFSSVVDVIVVIVVTITATFNSLLLESQ